MDWPVLEEFHRDPADPVIVATARLLNLKVVTSDARVFGRFFQRGGTDDEWTLHGLGDLGQTVRRQQIGRERTCR